MKLLHKNVDKDGGGSVSLIPEEPEDMWHAYNLISEGDCVRASTIRKVQNESTTGSSTSSRVRTILTIRVENIDFDTQACMLRLKGRNIEENQYVKMGGYHTLDLEVNRKFTLGKAEWDSVSLDRVDSACDPVQGEVWRGRQEWKRMCQTTLRSGNDDDDDDEDDMEGMARFFENVMQAILRHVNFDIVKCILIASPGFVRDQFFEYMFQQAVKTDNKILLENKGKFMLIHASSGFKHSLRGKQITNKFVVAEVLTDPAVVAKMADTKAASEVKAMETFYTMLQTEPDKAFYGPKHVEKASEAQAIETLLISDNLFRIQDVKLRKRYVTLVDSVREFGGDVKIFSSMHVSGEQLDQLTGVAAILRFPMPELEEDDEESDEENGK
uniref:eRF1/Pelota-like N-terminal domain-containing protein n=2 Tax=Timema TaxID=61471 RepID=A0A7R8VSV1_TIMDO|nr:unnamed protein product [Timema douglasi]